jgi:hypothetical protein
MILATTLATVAIVTQNQSVLRAAPRDSATQQATLWQGEALEVRGRKLDYLQVYDHHLERAGYIKASQVKLTSLAPADAPQLLTVVRFLRDSPGSEALGISYAAAYLKAVPAEQLTAEPFDALGTMADRLAQRASTNRSKALEPTLAAHLDVATSLGLGMKRYERDGNLQVCYDGEMFRRVLAMASAEPSQKARAALGLTRHECVDPALGPTDRYEVDRWRADVLDRVPAAGLDPQLENRVHLRRAGVWSGLAYAQLRRGEVPQGAAGRALQELASVDKAELSEEDTVDYNDSAVRVGSSRWGAEPVHGRGGKLTISTTPGVPGETCVILQDAKHDVRNPLAQRCTFGNVWVASASSNWSGSALTLAVQPLATWRELWVFHETLRGWTVDVLPPGTGNPVLGYVEFAGWVPGGKKMLVARETQVDGKFRRRFEVVRVESLTTERSASTPELLPTFARWQDASWKQTTVAMR